jgi:hypothetical protein
VIRVLNDHPGTRIGGARVKGRLVSLEMLREPMTRADWTTHDYNVHFCVGIENIGDNDAEIELSVEGGRWDSLPDRKPLLYGAPSADGPFAPVSFPARTDFVRRYAVRIKMVGGGRLYVGNTLVRNLLPLAAELDDLARAGNATRCVIGRTLQNREIAGYIYGDPTKGVLLVTSGFHPPEPDTLATTAIMRYLVSSEGQALLEHLAIALVPIANPDGYANGTQGANAAGINFYWHFARELPERCPEAAALWRFAETLAPCGYIDFHSYTFQLGKRAGAYKRPLFFYDGAAVRAAGAALYRRLRDEALDVPVTGFGTFAPHTLGSMLARRFDTLTLAKYHLHLAEGEDGCHARGLRVFRAMAEILLAHGLAAPALPRPSSWREPWRHALVCWAGLLRPTIGHVRRGQFGRMRFDRTALVTPPSGANSEKR